VYSGTLNVIPRWLSLREDHATLNHFTLNTFAP
jgi:hypothetical protein